MAFKLSISFDALTLLVERQEGHLASKSAAEAFEDSVLEHWNNCAKNKQNIKLNENRK